MEGFVTYKVRLAGTSPIIHHSGIAGLDTRSPLKMEIAEITSKKGSNRTSADEQRLLALECENSLWLDEERNVTVPVGAVRACVEAAARKTKHGPMVREGLLVTKSAFEYDVDKYGDALEEIAATAQFTVPVVVQRARILRTRARFDCPWSIVTEVETDEEIVQEELLRRWFEVGGQRIGIGDWRPQKSGTFGRFVLAEMEAI